jgi:hypothetical protein
MSYQTIVGVILTVGGILFLVFREQFVDNQKKRAATKVAAGNNALIYQQILARPRSSSIRVVIMIGLFFIIIGALQLFGII